MELYKVRLGPKSPTLPFSLIYVFRGWDLPLMRRHFETFLGFPARHFDHDLSKVRVGDGRRNGPFLTEIIPDLFLIESNWHLAVPILTGQAPRQRRRNRKKEGEDARELYGKRDLTIVDTGPYVMYLTETRWRNWVTKGPRPPTSNSPYPETAYLSTVQGVLAPPCLACPRLILHEGGECEIGDETCFSLLRQFKVQGQMRRLLKTYDDMKKEEEARVFDGDSDRKDPSGGSDTSV